MASKSFQRLFPKLRRYETCLADGAGLGEDFTAIVRQGFVVRDGSLTRVERTSDIEGNPAFVVEAADPGALDALQDEYARRGRGGAIHVMHTGEPTRRVFIFDREEAMQAMLHRCALSQATAEKELAE